MWFFEIQVFFVFLLFQTIVQRTRIVWFFWHFCKIQRKCKSYMWTAVEQWRSSVPNSLPIGWSGCRTFSHSACRFSLASVSSDSVTKPELISLPLLYLFLMKSRRMSIALQMANKWTKKQPSGMIEHANSYTRTQNVNVSHVPFTLDTLNRTGSFQGNYFGTKWIFLQ